MKKPQHSKSKISFDKEHSKMRVKQIVSDAHNKTIVDLLTQVDTYLNQISNFAKGSDSKIYDSTKLLAFEVLSKLVRIT